MSSEWFALLYTPFTITFGILLVLVTAVFSWIALQRTGFLGA